MTSVTALGSVRLSTALVDEIIPMLCPSEVCVLLVIARHGQTPVDLPAIYQALPLLGDAAICPSVGVLVLYRVISPTRDTWLDQAWTAQTN